MEPLVAADGWVIDGMYRGKLGDLTLARADTVVWLDLPRRVWLTRLVRRTLPARLSRREELWNGTAEGVGPVKPGDWVRMNSLPQLGELKIQVRAHQT